MRPLTLAGRGAADHGDHGARFLTAMGPDRASLWPRLTGLRPFLAVGAPDPSGMGSSWGGPSILAARAVLSVPTTSNPDRCLRE